MSRNQHFLVPTFLGGSKESSRKCPFTKVTKGFTPKEDFPQGLKRRKNTSQVSDEDAPVETVAHKESGTEGAWGQGRLLKVDKYLGTPGGVVVSISDILR